MIQVFSFVTGREINAAGDFFRYMKASSTGKTSRIKVKVNGSSIGTYEEGDSIRLPEASSRWEIEALVPGTVGEVQIGFGDVRSSHLTGDVSIIDEVTEALETRADGQLVVGAFSARALVTATENVNGVIIRAVSTTARAGAGGISFASIVACPVQPTSYSAPSKRIVLCSSYDNSGGLKDQSVLMNKRIPPGWGIWFAFDVQVSAPLANAVQVQCELQ